MKKYFSAIAALALLFACTPENSNETGKTENEQDELTVTGDVLEVTEYSATLTGYANLPFELGDALYIPEYVSIFVDNIACRFFIFALNV